LIANLRRTSPFIPKLEDLDVVPVPNFLALSNTSQGQSSPASARWVMVASADIPDVKQNARSAPSNFASILQTSQISGDKFIMLKQSHNKITSYTINQLRVHFKLIAHLFVFFYYYVLHYTTT
jgi:hypothetical protein